MKLKVLNFVFESCYAILYIKLNSQPILVPERNRFLFWTLLTVSLPWNLTGVDEWHQVFFNCKDLCFLPSPPLAWLVTFKTKVNNTCKTNAGLKYKYSKWKTLKWNYQSNIILKGYFIIEKYTHAWLDPYYQKVLNNALKKTNLKKKTKTITRN